VHMAATIRGELPEEFANFKADLVAYFDGLM
jgi:hypothetical protein